MAKKLTPKQKAFCEEYIIDFNGTQSAIRAGYSKNSANEIASQNLAKLSIQEYVQELTNNRSKRTEITADRVLNEIAKLAFFNMADVINSEGNTKPLQDWSRDELAALQEITESKIDSKEGVIVTTLKTKISDKKASLELLGRHLKLFTDKVDLNADMSVTFNLDYSNAD